MGSWSMVIIFFIQRGIHWIAYYTRGLDFQLFGFQVLGFQILGFQVLDFQVLGFWILRFRVLDLQVPRLSIKVDNIFKKTQIAGYYSI